MSTLADMNRNGAEREAITRLFELARAGEVDNVEFDQLDSLVYTRLLQAYEGDRHGAGGATESIS